MGKNSSIEWTHHTGGPWLGCTKVSPGCTNCYALELMLLWFASIMRKAYKAAGFADWETRPVWGDHAPRVRTKGFWDDARKLNTRAGKEGTRYRMFPSMIDWLDNMPAGIIDQEGNWLDKDAVLADLLKLIHDTPNLDWLLLTKRPGNFFERVEDAINYGCEHHEDVNWCNQWSTPDEQHSVPSNVWIGTSVEDQQRANERIRELLKIPAAVRFLSVEPMLGPIDFHRSAPCGYYCSEEHGHVDHQPLNGIHWAIFGGESGPNARPCNIEWIRNGVKQCQAAGVAPFVKQLGGNVVYNPRLLGGPPIWDAVAKGLKDKKGGDMSEWPEDLRIREFPLTPNQHAS